MRPGQLSRPLHRSSSGGSAKSNLSVVSHSIRGIPRPYAKHADWECASLERNVKPVIPKRDCHAYIRKLIWAGVVPNAATVPAPGIVDFHTSVASKMDDRTLTGNNHRARKAFSPPDVMSGLVS